MTRFLGSAERSDALADVSTAGDHGDAERQQGRADDDLGGDH
jgi:hypothetical protein